jgi:hypothetical protein
MDLKNVLIQLRKERDAIDAAIISLERLYRRANRTPARLLDLAPKSAANGAAGGYRPPNQAPAKSN